MAKTFKAIGLFAVGAVIGTAAGVLYAPRAGKHTRARLRNSAGRAFHRADEIRSGVQVRLAETIKETSQAVRERIDEGRERVGQYVRAISR
jgi:gas vesicle protein